MIIRLTAPDANGAVRRRGSRSRPAWVGVDAFTAWKRWGMLTTIEVKGKPVKNAFLCSCQRVYLEDGNGEKYNSIPASTRFFNKRMGKIGFCSFCRLSILISYCTKENKEQSPMIRGEMIAALFQGKRVPASSSAYTMRIDATSMSDAPSKSRRRNAESVKRARRRAKRFCLLVEKSEGRQKITRAVAAAPAGALRIVSPAGEEWRRRGT